MPTVDLDRFSGFAELYEAARPRPPVSYRQLVQRFSPTGRFSRVLDLGCGTGLSTALWQNHCDHLIGLEPNSEMRGQAVLNHPMIPFTAGSSYATGQGDHSCDLVTCSQAFHWMEPTATLAEVARILAPEGVLAVLDCDWPVSWQWQAEQAYQILFQQVRALHAQIPELQSSGQTFPKDRHQSNLAASGHFRHVARLSFADEQPCDADRFLAIALSQGHLRSVLKHRPDALAQPLANFEAVVRRHTQTTMVVCYQLLVAIK